MSHNEESLLSLCQTRNIKYVLFFSPTVKIWFHDCLFTSVLSYDYFGNFNIRTNFQPFLVPQWFKCFYSCHGIVDKIRHYKTNSSISSRTMVIISIFYIKILNVLNLLILKNEKQHWNYNLLKSVIKKSKKVKF